MDKLFGELPGCLDDDDEVERLRSSTLYSIRSKIASRFLEVSENPGLRELLWKRLGKLKEMYGPEIVFSPWPSLEQEEQSPKEALHRLGSVCSNASTSSKSTESQVLPHKFFYLCKASTVWTVVQAYEPKHFVT